ncbi:MAG: serine/threonine protein kinase [Acutalibacteraceae bacterium]
MTVGEIAAICGIPSALTVAIVGFFVWLLERSIVKRETARAEEEARREKARAAEDAKLEAERTKQENSRKVFEKNLLASTNAALAVSEATARAVQRIPDAHCNGDMHAALNYAAKIKHEQRDFLAAQGIDNIF